MSWTLTVAFTWFSLGIMFNSVEGDQSEDFFSQQWCACIRYDDFDFTKCQNHLRTEFSNVARVDEFTEKFIKDESMCGFPSDNYLNWPESTRKHFNFVERYGVFMLVPRLSITDLFLPSWSDKPMTTSTTTEDPIADYRSSIVT